MLYGHSTTSLGLGGCGSGGGGGGATLQYPPPNDQWARLTISKCTCGGCGTADALDPNAHPRPLRRRADAPRLSYR